MMTESGCQGDCHCIGCTARNTVVQCHWPICGQTLQQVAVTNTATAGCQEALAVWVLLAVTDCSVPFEPCWLLQAVPLSCLEPCNNNRNCLSQGPLQWAQHMRWLSGGS